MSLPEDISHKTEFSATNEEKIKNLDLSRTKLIEEARTLNLKNNARAIIQFLIEHRKIKGNIHWRYEILMSSLMIIWIGIFKYEDEVLDKIAGFAIQGLVS